jgi:predicted AlkP superfamily pyrophosphatase or phosphodiesterase
MKGLRSHLLVALGVAVVFGLQGAVPIAAASPEEPRRALIIVLDQTRKDTIARYKMNNVQNLMNGGVSFPNAYLGHMAAETVVSHDVITSGLFPKHMGGRTRFTATSGTFSVVGTGRTT